MISSLLAFNIEPVEFDVRGQHVGCFKDDPSKRDLPFPITEEDDHDAQGSLEGCVKACQKMYFM